MLSCAQLTSNFMHIHRQRWQVHCMLSLVNYVMHIFDRFFSHLKQNAFAH